jgi:hypothetical protein
MANFKRSDLKYNYNWTAAKENDNAKITGFPDSYLLDRNEGYEVLPFINRYMDSIKWTLESSFHKIEKAIKVDLPGTVRGHATIKKWLLENVS